MSSEHSDNAHQNAKIFGVSELLDLDDLLPKQRNILRRIFTQILEIARDEAQHELKFPKGGDGSGDSSYATDVARREPVFTFLIDGVRGSGKTSLARTLRGFLDLYGREQRQSTITNPVWQRIFGQGSEFVNPIPLKSGNARRVSVYCLPFIKPDDLDVSESIMEAVFAQMLTSLQQHIDRLEKDEQANEQIIEKAHKLENQLNNEVAKGWYFARRMGVEALLNDSMSFEDYIERRSVEAATSHVRVEAWRKFVVEYLDLFDAEMLGIFIDDTDISRHLTVDLLHSIRMFLCHPRICSVVAANLHTTRQKLLSSTLSDLSDAYKTLRSSDSYTAKLWRDFERDNLEEYLAKVFPRQRRNFIKLGENDFAQLLKIWSETKAGDDDKKSSTERKSKEPQSFVGFCSSQMSKRVAAMLSSAGSSSDGQGGSTRPRLPEAEANELEDYLALWMIRNHYAEELMPRSARHINQFADMIAEQAPASNILPRNSRRVAVAIFTEPLNFQIVQRLTDHDSKVMDWINAQQVFGEWRGGRTVRINKLDLTPKNPSYYYILYRLDLAFAKPDHANQNANFPITLLPEPSGRKVWTPEIWQRSDRKAFEKALDTRQNNPQENAKTPPPIRLRQDQQGLARTFSNPIIPANCLYFKDLRALPDLAWAWNETLEDGRRTFGQFPIRHVDTIFRLNKSDPRDDYFQKIVLLYASFPLMPPIPPDEFVAENAQLIDIELCNLGLTRTEMSEESDDDVFQNTLGGRNRPVNWISEGARVLAEPIRYASLGKAAPILHLTTENLKGFSRLALVDTAIRLDIRKDTRGKGPRQWAEDAKIALQDQNGSYTKHPYLMADDIVSIAPRYTRILNDVRRAYHALRILEGDLNDYAFALHSERYSHSKNQRGDEDTLEREGLLTNVLEKPFIHSRNDRYRLVGIEKLRACIGLPSRSLLLPADDEEWSANIDGRYCLKDPDIHSGSQKTGKTEDARDSTWGIGVYEEQNKTNKGNSTIKIVLSESEEIFLTADQSSVKISRQNTTMNVDLTKHTSQYALRQFGFDEKEKKVLLKLLNTAKAEDAKRGRILRSRLLFLWGLGPCLSSLMHLEVMGHIYDKLQFDIAAVSACVADSANKKSDDELKRTLENLEFCFDDKAKKAALGVLTEWQRTLIVADLLVFLFARSLEINIQSGITEVKKLRKNSAPFEDDRRLKPVKIDPKNLATKFRPMPDFSPSTLGIRPSRQAPVEDARIEFGGIVQDTLTRIHLAQIYADILRRRIENIRVKNVGEVIEKQLRR